MDHSNAGQRRGAGSLRWGTIEDLRRLHLLKRRELRRLRRHLTAGWAATPLRAGRRAEIAAGNEGVLAVAEELAVRIEEALGNPVARRHLTGLFRLHGSGSYLSAVKSEQQFLSRPAPPFTTNDGIAAWRRFSDDLCRDVELFGVALRDLDALRRTPIRLKVIGFGEISSIVTVDRAADPWRREVPAPVSALESMAFKCLPPFSDSAAAQRFVGLLNEYHDVLARRVGIALPDFSVHRLPRPDGRIVLVQAQQRYPCSLVGHQVLRRLAPADCGALITAVLNELAKVAFFNHEAGDTEIGFDAQLSNWVVVGFDAKSARLRGDERMVYIDTTTPLIRHDGVEQIDPDLFLQTVPAPLRPLLRVTMLPTVVGRYYQTRQVMVDLVANLIKEGRADALDEAVAAVNRCFAGPLAPLDLEPLTRAEVERYYRADARIWRTFQAYRRLDRFVTERILRRRYPVRLPGRIAR